MKSNKMIHRGARAAIKLLLAALLPATAQSAWAGGGINSSADIIVNITGSGTVKYNGTPITSGYQTTTSEAFTLTMKPADGYTFQRLECYAIIQTTDLTDKVTGPNDNSEYTYYNSSNPGWGTYTYTVTFAEQGTTPSYNIYSSVQNYLGSAEMTFSVNGQTVTKAEEGQQVDITLPTPSANQYWEVSSLDVTITKDDATHFHFTMPANAVTVTASLHTEWQQVYHITDNSTNGHVVVSGGDADGDFNEGEIATLTPTPDTGYEYVVNSLTATNNYTHTAIDLTDNGNGTWSFQMPAAVVIVSATFSWNTEYDYTVHFDKNANDATNTMADQVFKFGVSQALTANTFTREGYTFTGWNTKSNGSGTSYTDGQSVSDLTTVHETVTLYAQWTPYNPGNDPGNETTYTVHFDANGGEGTMSNQSFQPGVWQSLNANTFTREGYTFTGWNTKSDGSGTSYTNQENIYITSSMTLYAQWSSLLTGNHYAVHFDKNDANARGSMADQMFTVGEAQALTANAFHINVLYPFKNWNTKADGSGTSYADGAIVTDLAAAGETVTLYAQWGGVGQLIWGDVVHFDANGGEGTMSNQSFQPGVSQALTANAFTREGYTFTGWNTAADGSGTSYTNQENIYITSSMTLYAQWSLNSSTHYAVHFNANGGSRTMADQGIAADGSADLKTCTFTREGYKFTGWSTTASGTIVYLDGENVSGLASAGQTVNLYAQWNKGAMTIAKEQGGIVVTLDGDSDESFSITSNIVADRVILRRKFVAGVPTTICLPFAFSNQNFDHEVFSTLNYVNENQETHQLEAHMTPVSELQANTPYYFLPSESTATPANEDYTEIVFTGVTIVAGNAGSSTTSGWTIVGNYDRVKWTTNTADPLYSSTHAAELGRAYGYAKTTKTVGGVTYQEGQFVKLGNGAHTRAFRAYMLAPATTNSPDLLPDAIDVVWHNDDATSIASMSDGRSQMSDVWYTINGVKLAGKPTTKGLYIHNGRKEVVK
jgi:uncharacterized repeat protein (TIGR02543 family)